MTLAGFEMSQGEVCLWLYILLEQGAHLAAGQFQLIFAEEASCRLQWKLQEVPVSIFLSYKTHRDVPFLFILELEKLL